MGLPEDGINAREKRPRCSSRSEIPGTRLGPDTSRPSMRGASHLTTPCERSSESCSTSSVSSTSDSASRTCCGSPRSCDGDLERANVEGRGSRSALPRALVANRACSCARRKSAHIAAVATTPSAPRHTSASRWRFFRIRRAGVHCPCHRGHRVAALAMRAPPRRRSALGCGRGAPARQRERASAVGASKSPARRTDARRPTRSTTLATKGARSTSTRRSPATCTCSTARRACAPDRALRAD